MRTCVKGIVMEPWVAPCLTGGLGNRLFQIAAACKVSEETGKKPTFFLPRLTRLDHGNFDLLRVLCPHIPFTVSDTTWHEVKEGNFNKANDVKGNLVIRGYFQDLKYFPSWHNLYMPSIHPSLMKYPIQSVAIHFRFGDYCKLKHHQVDLRGYYYQAIHKYPKGTHFTLFSDESDKLESICNEISSWGFLVDIYKSSHVLETILTYSSCSLGSICSNSTFAWWCGFLSKEICGDTYKMYIPDKWLSEGDFTPVLYGEEYPFIDVIDVKKEWSGILSSFVYE
jgi:hypothetical protein